MVERVNETPANTRSVLSPWLQGQLTTLLARRGHAWLLQGPSGLGQYTLALELARAWLCDQPTAHGACYQCRSCHAVDVRTHADLCTLMPETLSLELRWPLDEKTQKDLDDKKRKPSKEIRVEAARDMVGFSQQTRSGGKTKVVLVYPAERMNHILLPTIRSRCQTHTMVWPSVDESLAWLQGQGVSDADAPVLLRAAGGRTEDALALAGSGLKAAHWAALPKAIARGDVSAVSDGTPAQAIAMLQKLCHDLLAMRTGAAPRFFLPTDLPTAGSVASLSQWSRDLMQAARTAEHPFNAGLMFEALVARAQLALRAKS
jgi:DNA polymerase-3 subunit delta'